MNRRIFLALLALCITITVLTPIARPGATASASSFFFTTGEPDGRMAAASRPESRHKIELEAADDFILTSQTIIDRATFTGLLFQGGHGRTLQFQKRYIKGQRLKTIDLRSKPTPTQDEYLINDLTS